MDGTLVIPNLSDENSAEDVDVDVNIITSGPEGDALKTMLRKYGTTMLRQQFAKYIASLKEG